MSCARSGNGASFDLLAIPALLDDRLRRLHGWLLVCGAFSMSEWIPSKILLPEGCVDVLGWLPKHGPVVCWYDKEMDEWFCTLTAVTISSPSYWMPILALPEPPP